MQLTSKSIKSKKIMQTFHSILDSIMTLNLNSTSFSINEFNVYVFTVLLLAASRPVFSEST